MESIVEKYILNMIVEPNPMDAINPLCPFSSNRLVLEAHEAATVEMGGIHIQQAGSS